MKNIPKVSLVIPLLVSGCLSVPEVNIDQDIKAKVDDQIERIVNENKEHNSNVVIVDTPISEVFKRVEEDKLWIKERVSIGVKEPIPAFQLLEMFRQQGVNLSSSMPLHYYTYSGFGVKDVPIETALKIMIPAMGLDYDINHKHRYVTIRPMKSKSWNFDFGNRVTKFQSTTVSGSSSSLGGGTSAASDSSSGGLLGGSTSSDGGTASSGSVGSGVVSVEDDFWQSMNDELTARLKIRMPKQEIAGQSVGTSGQPFNIGPASLVPSSNDDDDEDQLYEEQQVGSFSLNRSTGQVTVQAPEWMLTDIDAYMQEQISRSKTTLQFEGRVLLVNTTKGKSEGLDLNAFISVANGDYGLSVTNNALGGVTFSKPNELADTLSSVSTNGEALAGSLLGVRKLNGTPMQAFIGYLESLGDVSIVQRPTVSTTSGVPAEYASFEPVYYTIIQQEAASTDSGTNSGLTNEVVRELTGTLMRVNPRIDFSTGLVRTQITLAQAIRSGTQTIEQFATGEDGGLVEIPTDVPIILRQDINGEILLKDGDLVIVGGQVTEIDRDNSSGVTGYQKAGLFGGLMGKTSKEKQVQTYYFAMTVRSVERR